MIALLLAAGLMASSDPDGVIATANRDLPPLTADTAPTTESLPQAVQAAAAHGLTTDQQITQWLDAATEAPAPYSLTEEPRDDRQVHGMVSAGIGTGGYRDYGASVSVPIGDSGRLDLHYRQTENGRYGYGPYDYDPFSPYGRYNSRSIGAGVTLP